MTELKAIPLFADEQIKSLQNSTTKMIHEIQESAILQNRKRYASAKDMESSAELATDVSVQAIINMVNYARNTVESIVHTHYDEQFNDQMTIEQICVVVRNSMEQIDYISKQYLDPTKVNGSQSSNFNFYI